MKNKLIFLTTGIIGAMGGSFIALLIAAQEHEGSKRAVLESVKAYFIASGVGYTSVFELLVGTTAGAYLLTLVVVVIAAGLKARQLQAVYQTFDLDAKYLVAQRSRETMLIGILLFLAAIAVLYVFSSLHGYGKVGELDREASTVRYPALTLFSSALFLFVCLLGSLVAFYGVMAYGRFKRIPIVLNENSIQFFRCFYRLPVIAIDQPVIATLEDADIDFKSQGGKSLLVIANDIDNKVIISPRLDFINGSFDELVDVVERFAIPDDE